MHKLSNEQSNEYLYVTSTAIKILGKYPLCDRCLGRLFAKLGYGWSNKQRGESIKRVVLMELHHMLRNEKIEKEQLETIAKNIGEHAQPLLRRLGFDDGENPRCTICGGLLDTFIEDISRRSIPILKAYDIKRFIVGAKVSGSIINKENQLKLEFRLGFGESIKAEIRREIGKLIQSLDKDLTVDFDNPEATLLVEYPAGAIYLQVNSLLIKGRYWKTGRMISQAYWPTPSGPKYYSIEEALWSVLRIIGAERVVLHAAGREDVDARMLGSGRPAIFEFKTPRKRHLHLRELEREANKSSNYVSFRFDDYASRKDVQLYKDDMAKTSKIYKALIVSDEPIDDDKLKELESFFTNRLIMQKTPSRVLHRRPNILRRRKVYSMQCHKIWDYVFECLINAEGGLYIKELVSGDDGRTTPSFSEVLGAPARCVELDVVSVKLRGHS